MVGIILASHGDFAQGILQSGSMIFGEQEDVKAVTLHPSEGPDILRQKMQDAIASFSSSDEVLFLVDLWGGTPFNQANGLCEAHENWSVVSGLNLPMLIEAYASRLSMDTAKEIAAEILAPAQDGIKSTTVQEKPKATKADAKQDTNAAVGNGKIDIVLARVDSRLLHGQVATAWTKFAKPNRIIVVSDSVAKDDLRKKLIMQAAPPGVKANVIPISKMIEVYKDPRFGNTKALLLFETPHDALRVIEGGVEINTLNIGSMAHSVGKVMVNKVLSMNENDVQCFDTLKQKNVNFDVRKVPNDSNENLDALLTKAKQELKTMSK